MSARTNIAECATPHGYNRYTHGCRCEECRAAKATYMRDKRARARAVGQRVVEGIKHGTAGYKDHLCRCETCLGAKTAEWERRKARDVGEVAS